MSRALRIARLCWATPLAIGVLIFLLWVVTHWIWLVVAGVIFLWVGVACFAVGGIALGRYWWVARRSAETDRRRMRRTVGLTAALLCSNFLVVFGIAVSFMAIISRETVTIVNMSPHPIVGARLTGSGCEIEIGTIEVGESARRSFWTSDDSGRLILTATAGSQDYSMTVIENVSHEEGSDTTVRIDSGGKASIEVQRRMR